MKWIAKYTYWLILFWLIGVLAFYKFHNNFQFINNQSIGFIILIGGGPICFIIIRKYYHHKMLKRYHLAKTDYYKLVKKELPSFIKQLEKKTLVKMQNDEIAFGQDLLGIITIDEEKIVVLLKNTMVSYSFYYGKTFEDKLLFDRDNLQNQSPKQLFTSINLLITSLIDSELVYEEAKKHNEIIYACLKASGVVKFVYSKKQTKKSPKVTKKIYFRL